MDDAERLAIIAAELADPAYAGLGDGAVWALLHAPKADAVLPVLARDVKRLWGRRMILAKCDVFASLDTTPVEVRVLLRATYDNLMGDLFADLDPNDPAQAPDIEAYLDGLVDAQVMTAQDKADTLALGIRPGTRAQELKIPDVTPSEIARARELL